MCQVSGVLGKRVDGHAEHQIIKETPGWTIFPLERSTPGRGGGMEECTGGGRDAWAAVWEAGRVEGGYPDEEWTALGLPQPTGPSFDHFSSREVHTWPWRGRKRR